MAFDILDKVKAVLNLSKTDNDTFLQTVIDDVEVIISNYIQQPISQIGVVLDNILFEDNELILPYTVPIGIISIKYKVPFQSGDYITIPTTDYYAYKKGSVTRVKFSYLNTNLIYEISCSVGWLNANIPLDILTVATDLVCWKFKESVKGENLLGKKSSMTNQNGQTTNIQYDYNFLNTRLELLHTYRKITS